MKSLDKKELKELIIKCWMTHDGMWFYHCLQEFGIEKTNKLNKAAGRSLAAIEIKRIKKAFDIGKIENFEELKDAIEITWEVLCGDFMDFSVSYPSNNIFHIATKQCFAYEGMKRMGVHDQYECGIFSRLEGWFEGLEVRYSVNPQVKGCMMETDGKCFRDYNFYFD